MERRMEGWKGDSGEGNGRVERGRKGGEEKGKGGEREIVGRGMEGWRDRDDKELYSPLK